MLGVKTTQAISLCRSPLLGIFIAYLTVWVTLNVKFWIGNYWFLYWFWKNLTLSVSDLEKGLEPEHHRIICKISILFSTNTPGVRSWAENKAQKNLQSHEKSQPIRASFIPRAVETYESMYLTLINFERAGSEKIMRLSCAQCVIFSVKLPALSQLESVRLCALTKLWLAPNTDPTHSMEFTGRVEEKSGLLYHSVLGGSVYLLLHNFKNVTRLLLCRAWNGRASR